MRNLFGLGIASIAALLACGGSSPKPPTFVKPAGTIAVGFSVDDTANKVFKDKELQWKGAMIYDPLTNKVSYDTNWGGPYAPLYDDGPWTAGGHEPAGATAGDHILGTVVFVAPPAAGAADLKFGYGLNDATLVATPVIVDPNGWLWPAGNDGAFTVAAGATADQKAEGLTLKKFGTTDFQIVIDPTALSAGTWDTSKVSIKGGGWGWSGVLLAASGGKYTYTQSAFTGTGNPLPHAGLLTSGDKPEFNVVFNGVEYKTSSNCNTGGVTAGVKASGASSFTTVTIAVNTTSHNCYITIP
jgi:hypothetical protein